MARAQFPDEQVEDRFERQEDAFRRWIRADGSGEFPVEANRYHLYVSLACPWASRTVIVRKLKRLEDAIGMTVVDPVRDERGWAFRDGPGYSRDPLNGWAFLSEAYFATEPGYEGRVTVPVLWDKKTRTIVSNSDDDIMRMLETEFDNLGDGGALDFYPAQHRDQVEALNEWIYETLNNGVYEAGFATSQHAYERGAYRVFETLDNLEERLSTRRYLVAEWPVETDWRAFVTLIRFDAVYVGHFKCNLRRIVDYPNLWGYVRDLYQYRGVADTVDFDHIKRHYYYTHDEINPTRIVPIGPQLDLTSPHGRDRLR
ncbi:MAG TPA: glutathione S-transferase family protein [Candidatus Baltobacteraceae bacterium]|nr:glutathione S-transferase family protein [Candidatus Baltobacteraceae bacterium]